ncbi:ATP-binding protein [Daejeonella sp.]|uniref:ATP-binding response regulator n=1 Tax=Daejeonella sp. TaxID=2805397 RepID=UPI0039839156
MSNILNILIVEDNRFDADLINRELKKSDLNFNSQIVQAPSEFESALDAFKPDIILSDYSLPSFDGATAFRIKQSKYPYIPFIIVSGVIGEENAVELIKSGVTDFVSKDKLFTLVQKIHRALKETKEREAREDIAQKLKIQSSELITANKELVFQNQEKEKRAEDLLAVYSDLKVQKDKLRRANNLLIKQEEKVNIINHELSQLNLELEERVVIRTQALLESEERFHTMMETIPQIAWTNTAQGNVTFYNQRWYDYTGYNYEGTLATGLKGVIHPDDIQNLIHKFQAIRKTTEGGEFQVRAKRADGQYLWHLIRLMPIKYEDGQVQIWVGTATDIHELRLLQQQKDDFIRIASHELKTPVTALKASLQLLNRIKHDPSPNVLPKLIEQANKSLERVSVLIRDLLYASTINEGQLPLNQKTFVLSKSIDECFHYIRLDDLFTITVEGDLKLEVYADAERLNQVVINFINNAMKYASRSKEINIVIERIDNMAKISVIDKGPGVPPEKIPYLFGRYYRVDNTGSQYSGLGLGLYISSEIIKRHNGQIGVSSELGKGSTFWFTLPLLRQGKIVDSK